MCLFLVLFRGCPLINEWGVRNWLPSPRIIAAGLHRVWELFAGERRGRGGGGEIIYDGNDVKSQVGARFVTVGTLRGLPVVTKFCQERERE